MSAVAEEPIDSEQSDDSENDPSTQQPSFAQQVVEPAPETLSKTSWRDWMMAAVEWLLAILLATALYWRFACVSSEIAKLMELILFCCRSYHHDFLAISLLLRIFSGILFAACFIPATCWILSIISSFIHSSQ